MNNENNKGSKVAVVAVVTAVIGLLVGFGAAKAMDMGDNNNSSNSSQNAGAPTTDTKAASLRVLLNNLNGQHADVASGVLRAGFDESPMFDPSAKALDVNSVALSKSVGAVYGPEAEAKFLEIWRSHITFFVKYAAALEQVTKLKWPSKYKT